MLAEIIMPKAFVAPALVHNRHPLEYAKLAAKLGGTPTQTQYNISLNKTTQALDFFNTPDFRVNVFAAALNNIAALCVAGTRNGKTSKITIDPALLTAAQYPLELCGADPNARATWPSLWLKDVHGDTCLLGWTEWKLAGLHRRLNAAGLPASPWMANLVRRNSTTLLNEGFGNPNELHTLQEADALRIAATSEGKKYASIRYRIWGEHYWNAFANTPGGTIGSSPKTLARYQWVNCHDPIALDWLNRHCTSIGGRLYPKTLRFVAPTNEQHLAENSSIAHSVDLLFAYQRGEKKFICPLGSNPIALLKQGVAVAACFV